MKRLRKNWITTAEMAKHLGVSVQTLHRRRKDGSLQQNTHYLSIGGRNAARPTYRWHKDKILAQLGIAPELKA